MKDIPFGSTPSPLTIPRAWMHTVSSSEDWEHALSSFVLINQLEEAAEEVLTVEIRNTTEIPLSSESSTQATTEGRYVFIWKEVLVHVEMEEGPFRKTIIFRANREPPGFLAWYRTVLKEKNPLRGQFLGIGKDHDGLCYLLRPWPDGSLEDLVQEDSQKKDIWDNTVAQLVRRRESNGVILEGPPGTGKSLTVGAVARAVLEEGFTVVLVTEAVAFNSLGRMIDLFFGPCLLCLEDLDGYAEDRITGRGGIPADLLQLINGIARRADPMVVLATTNYLELLDKAFCARPMRFNRKYRFDSPGNSELLRLFERYLPDVKIPGEALDSCERAGFTGAHIAEVARTHRLLLERKEEHGEYPVSRAISIVLDHFPSPKGLGGFADG